MCNSIVEDILRFEVINVTIRLTYLCVIRFGTYLLIFALNLLYVLLLS